MLKPTQPPLASANPLAPGPLPAQPPLIECNELSKEEK